MPILVAAYIVCSNAWRNDDKKCGAYMTFATFCSICFKCGDKINIDDVIGRVDPKDRFSHLECMDKSDEYSANSSSSSLLGTSAPTLQCFRCHMYIFQFEEKEPCTFGYKRGFKHLICPTSSNSRPFKRRLELPDVNHETLPVVSEEEKLEYIASHVPQTEKEDV